MRPRLTQLSLAVIMESTNIILVYCPPIAGIDTASARRVSFLSPIAPIAGIDLPISCQRQHTKPIAPHRGDWYENKQSFFAVVHYCPPVRRLILHAASGQLLNGGAPSTPSLRSPSHFPFRWGSFCDSKTITIKYIWFSCCTPSRKDDTIYMNKEILLHYA